MIASATIDGTPTPPVLSTSSMAHNIKNVIRNGAAPNGDYLITCSFVPPGGDHRRTRCTVSDVSGGRIVSAGAVSVEGGTGYVQVRVQSSAPVLSGGAVVMQATDTVFCLTVEGI